MSINHTVSAPLNQRGIDRIPSEWSEFASKLAAWVEEHLVNRRDAFGRYKPIEQRRGPNDTAYTDKSPLTRAVLGRHFRGGCHGDLIGLHSTVRDDDGRCRSRWLTVDIDCHDDAVDPEATWDAARTWYDRAVAWGFTPLLFDSNGHGGYHLILIFDGPTATAKVHAFGRWLIRDWKDLGLTEEPEVFPKQPSIPAGSFGNWLRLPGRHHTRDHFTRAWDGTGWLEGSDAIKQILGTEGTSADRIPVEAPEARKPPKPERVPIPDDLARDARLAREALPYVQHMADNYDDWLQIGMCLKSLGDEGLALWDDWSRNCFDKYEAGACGEKWGTFTPDGGLTLATLFHKAQENGWSGPSAASTNGYAGREEVEKGSQAQIILRLAEPVTLFHTPERKPFATIPVGGHLENHPIRSTSFRCWLVRAFYGEQGRPPSTDAIQGALGVLEARAEFDGPTLPVWTRVAGGADPDDPTFYLDLCNERWEVVEITRAGWRLVEGTPPVKFRRTNGMLPLPMPAPGGTLDDLRPYVNLASDEDWRLFVACLAGALRPSGPYPIVAINGEQGSAKSTTSRVFRRLVDPHVTQIRCEPRAIRDLMIAATNAWVVALDNISNLPVWSSDALCRLATGGGFATRTLYENDEETFFDAMRPALLNGIEDVATRFDLLDRCVVLSLPTIPEDQRREEAPFWRAFEAAHPQLLGALLDAVSGGLRELPSVKLDRLPRMADFARWGEAVGRSLGWGDGAFLRSYEVNRAAANEGAVESSPVALAVRKLMADGTEDWTGTATELLHLLAERAGESATRDKDWPRNAHALTGRLKRAAPALRKVGIEVLFNPRTNKKRTLTIRRDPVEVAERASPPSPSSPSIPSCGHNGELCKDLCHADRPDPALDQERHRASPTGRRASPNGIGDNRGNPNRGNDLICTVLSPGDASDASDALSAPLTGPEQGAEREVIEL